MFRWIADWWHALQRRIDMEILWPVCCEQARDLDHAKAAFCFHVFRDPAWLCLDEQFVLDFIDRLEPPDRVRIR
jgi:hypothetical protein